MGNDNFLDPEEMATQLHDNRVEWQWGGTMHVYEKGKLVRVIPPGAKLNLDGTPSTPATPAVDPQQALIDAVSLPARAPMKPFAKWLKRK